MIEEEVGLDNDDDKMIIYATLIPIGILCYIVIILLVAYLIYTAVHVYHERQTDDQQQLHPHLLYQKNTNTQSMKMESVESSLQALSVPQLNQPTTTGLSIRHALEEKEEEAMMEDEAMMLEQDEEEEEEEEEETETESSSSQN